jgi:hypothetical protein
VKYDLYQPGGVSKVDENQSSVISATMNPSGDGNFLIFMVGAQLTAIDRLQQWNS